MTVLRKRATERSTYIVTVAFKDEDGNDVIPNTIKWTLTDVDGNVINSRQDVAVAVPAASIDIVLKGADLSIPKQYVLWRRVTVEAEYNSSAGTDLPFNDEILFEVKALVNV